MNFRERGARLRRIRSEQESAMYAACRLEEKRTGAVTLGVTFYCDKSTGRYTVLRRGQILGTVKRADPSGAAHVRCGGWTARTCHSEPQFGFRFTSRKQAAEWLCDMVKIEA